MLYTLSIINTHIYVQGGSKLGFTRVGFVAAVLVSGVRSQRLQAASALLVGSANATDGYMYTLFSTSLPQL